MNSIYYFDSDEMNEIGNLNSAAYLLIILKVKKQLKRKANIPKVCTSGSEF